MPRITYIEFDGTLHDVDVQSGYSVMEGAVKNGIPGIDADCGGACACATCHVFVEDSWRKRLGDQADEEREMLESVDGRRESSRLSCQITVTDTLDGLVVRMPESQH